ncbi:MAG: hypothetical protein JW804_05040 [Sedimentisphaerales bacterium]|nr:hypothetical protein [Sedimentisphaerales bacterium]
MKPVVEAQRRDLLAKLDAIENGTVQVTEDTAMYLYRDLLTNHAQCVELGFLQEEDKAALRRGYEMMCKSFPPDKEACE